MSLFSRDNGQDLVGKLCKLTNPGDSAPRYAKPTQYEKGRGWTWGTCEYWFKHAEEFTPNPDARQDAGADLIGTLCYVWDDKFSSRQQEIVTDYMQGKAYKYRADGIWAHARPVALGPLPESAEETIRNPFAMPAMHDFISSQLGVMRDSSSDSPKPKPKPTATWDQVKGQDEAKQALREAVELPRQFSELYAAYGKKASKGALLYGPPGCGKTMLGRTLAGVLGCGDDGFRYVKGGELFAPHVGAEEKAIREIFQKAKQYKARTGFPQIVFFDEADALFPMRRGGNSNSTAGYDFMASTIGAFLTELDGLEECGAFVILSTNRPEVMDPAVLRDGRIDRKVLVARPTKEVAQDILAAGLSKAPGFNAGLIETALSAIYDQKLCYYIAETEDRGAVRVNFYHQISGALLDGIVERTVNGALQRDIAAGSKKPTGVTAKDVLDAVDGSWRSTLGLDLQWLLEEVVGQHKIDNIKTLNGRYLGIKKNEGLKVQVEHKMDSDAG